MVRVAEDISIADAPGRKEKQQKSSKGHEITTRTIKTPYFSYAYLELISDSPIQSNLDDLTVRSYLTFALTRFLGLAGSSISIDILKVEARECWIRVPREDLSPVMAAVGGWVGGNEADGQVAWTIKASGNWLSTLVGNNGVDKIWD